MLAMLHWMKSLMNRWGGQQETSIWQMTNRKSVDGRIAGYVKSERAEAKFFLFAMLPFVPLMIWDWAGMPRGLPRTIWAGLSVLWAVWVIGTGLVSLGRSIARSIRDSRSGS